MVAHLVKATDIPPENGGTGWHFHVADFQIVIMTKGWARFMYEDQDTLVAAGDWWISARASCIASTTTHSPDMEYLEIVGPTDFCMVDAEGPCAIPPPTPWQ